MPDAGHRRMSRSMLIAGMLPIAVFLGAGVATASPADIVLSPADAPQSPVMPSPALDWQSIARDVQGLLPFPLPLPAPPADGVAVPRNSPAEDGPAPAEPVDVPSAEAVTAPPAEAVDAPPAVDQHPVEAFCAQVPADPDRCAATVVDAGVGAAIGAGIGAAVSAPLAIPAGMLGAAAGFVVGLPFLPTGVVVGPLLGAAVGVAVVAGPAAALGGALGAAVGTIVGITAPVPPTAGPIGATDAPTPAVA